MKEIKTFFSDRKLGIEIYYFKNSSRPFKNHFHEHFTIGLMESGVRVMSAKNKDYMIKKDDIVLFNPYDNHSCRPDMIQDFDFIGINASKNVIEEIFKERNITFSKNVVQDEEAAFYIKALFEAYQNNFEDFKKEEIFLLLINSLAERYAEFAADTRGLVLENFSKEENSDDKIFSYFNSNFDKKINLDEVCKAFGYSKSGLMRTFLKKKGITPYRYLESIRVNEGKKLLEAGITPADAAIKTGFSDQSHFTNAFRCTFGFTPAYYKKLKQETCHG